MLRSLIWDNPVLVKHVRARLRRQHLLPWMAVVIILAGCITWIGYAPGQYDANPSQRLALFLLLLLQGLLLFLIGGVQVAGSVAAAREHGTLDFHRISPQRPSALALGFLLGAPIRELVLFACTLPFTIPFFSLGRPGSLGMGGVLLIMLTCAFFYYALALLFGLIAPKPRGTGVLVVILIIVLNIFSMLPVITYLGIGSTVDSLVIFGTTPTSHLYGEFFGLTLPTLLIAALHQLILGGFLFAASVRKMRHERAYAFTRPVALLFYALIGVLMFGDAVHHQDIQGYVNELYVRFAVPSIIYGMLVIGVLLVPGVTPGLADFIKGIRHAMKLGQRRVARWSDFAANWPPLLLLTVLLFATAALAGLFIKPVRDTYFNDWYYGEIFAQSSYILAGALAAGTLLYYGLAKQAFALYFRKHNVIYFALTFFVLWGVPLLVLMVASITDASSMATEAIAGLSPISSIMMVIRGSHSEFGELSRMLAFISTGVYTVFFAAFYVIAYRRATALAGQPGCIVPPSPVGV